jgi:hypothetical protein
MITMINQWIWGDPIFNQTHISEMIWTYMDYYWHCCGEASLQLLSSPGHIRSVAPGRRSTPWKLVGADSSVFRVYRRSKKFWKIWNMIYSWLSWTFSDFQSFPRFRLDHSIVSGHLRFVTFVNFWDTCGSGPVGVLFRNVAKRDDKNCSVEHGDTTCNEHSDLKGSESGGSL